MIVIPTQAKQLPFPNLKEKIPAVLFVFKPPNKAQPVSATSFLANTSSTTTTSPPPLTPTPPLTSTTPTGMANNVTPPSKSPVPIYPPSTAYDCNMDQFMTKMSKKGRIIWAETSNLKFPNVNNASANNTNNLTIPQRNGLLSDFNSGKSVNILDYVHSNDQSHINQHINNGFFKLKKNSKKIKSNKSKFKKVSVRGENTSAIYRVKITDKYAFVQTSSKLVNFNPDIDTYEVEDNDNQIIFSTHSIIK